MLDSRTSQLDAVETIERSSIDFYATTRNLYRQSRNAKINEGKPGGDGRSAESVSPLFRISPAIGCDERRIRY